MARRHVLTVAAAIAAMVPLSACGATHPTAVPVTQPAAATSPSLTTPTVPATTTGPFRVSSAWFVSARVGWVLGSRGCVAPECPPTVLRTTDGGRHWTQVAAPDDELRGDEEGGREGVAEVHFDTATTGFLSGDSLWATEDGGAHWSREAKVADVPFPRVESLTTTPTGAFVALYPGVIRTGKEGVEIGYAPAGTTTFRPVQHMAYNRTIDDLDAAGASGLASAFATLDTVTPTAVISRPLPAHLALFCGNEAGLSTAVLVVDCTKAVFPPGGDRGPFTFYRSNDEGRTWAVDSPPLTGYLGGAGGSALLPDGTIITATYTDGPHGGTYLVRHAPGAKDWPRVLSVPAIHVTDLHFVDATHGSVVALPVVPDGVGRAPLGGGLYLTSDAGRSWHRVAF